MKLWVHHMVTEELHHEIQHDHNPWPLHQVVPLSQKQRHCIYLKERKTTNSNKINYSIVIEIKIYNNFEKKI